MLSGPGVSADGLLLVVMVVLTWWSVVSGRDRQCLLKKVSVWLMLRLLQSATQEPEGPQRCVRALRNRLQASVGTVCGLLLSLRVQVALGQSVVPMVLLSMSTGLDSVFPTLPNIMLPQCSAFLCRSVGPLLFLFLVFLGRLSLQR